jgi:hypothetical protein
VALLARKTYGAQPEEFWWQWDLPMVRDAMALVSKEEIDWCYVDKWRYQNLSQIPQTRVTRG